jgi:hypothetical protein
MTPSAAAATIRDENTDEDLPQNDEADERLLLSKPKNPYPRWSLFVVFMIQFSEPITGKIIYPFAPALVRSTGVTHGDEKLSGYYAGFIVSDNSGSDYWIELISLRKAASS